MNPYRLLPSPTVPYCPGRQGHQGFALLTVLWLITATSLLVGASVAVGRLGFQTTTNRVLLTRAGWAREACVEILLARYAEDPTVRALGPVDLGRHTWCRARLEDPAAKLNVNLADEEALRHVVSAARVAGARADSLVARLLDWRDADGIPRPLGEESPSARNGPLADLAELRSVRGFDDSLVARLSTFLTTRGTGLVDVNAAPAELLGTLPGMSQEAVWIVASRREVGRPVQSADELAAQLSPPARTLLLAAYAEFVRAAVFAPSQLMATVEGGVGGTPIVARATLTLVPVPGRLAVIRRETE